MGTQPNPIDDASALKALLLNLYTGWGYNAYRQENKDRADDLLIRNGVCALLGEARAALAARATAIRRTIPMPSRETPFPGAGQRAQIADIEALDRDIEAVEALIRHLPVPENDTTWLRHRAEREFLPRLLDADEGMVAQAWQVRECAGNGGGGSVGAGADLPAVLAAIAQHLDALRASIASRRAIL